MIGLAIIIVGAIVLYKVGPPLIRSFLNWCSKSPECTLYIPAQQHQPPVRFEPVQPTLVFPATDPYVYVAQQQPYSMPVANAVGNRVPSPSTNHGIFVRPQPMQPIVHAVGNRVPSPSTNHGIFVRPQSMQPIVHAVGNRVPSPSTNHGIFVRPSLAPANAGARVSGGPQPGQYNHNGT